MPTAHPNNTEDATTALTTITDSPCVDEPDNPTTPPGPLKLTDQTNLLPPGKVVVVFAGLAICIVVSSLDSAITATALPTISAYFNAGSIVSWVPSAYLLTSTSFQPLYGRFSDIFGRKVVVYFALSMFMVGSLASGFSRNFIELVVWRGIAGAGGGGIVCQQLVMLCSVSTGRRIDAKMDTSPFRGRYQGIIGAVVAVGRAIGPPIGGALSEKVTWRWCFWVHLPVSLTAICMVLFVLPLKPVEGDVKKKLLVVDYLGTLLSLSGSTLIILPLIWGGVTFPWNSPVIIALLCSGILVIFLFCCWEWKGAELPIIPMYIFKHVTVTGVNIAMFINGFVFFSSFYYLPQFFEVALGYSPIRSGVSLLPVLVCQPISSCIAGVVVSKTGRYRTMIYVGFSISAIGCGCLSTVAESTPKALLALYMVLAGIGSGQTLQTTTVAAQASVPRKDMAVVTAARNFVRQMGGTLSLAIGSTIINNSLRGTLASLGLSASAMKTIVDNPAILGSHTSPARLASLGLAPAEAAYALTHGYMQGFKWVFVLNASLASVATLASIFMIKHQDLVRGDEDRLRAEAKRLLERAKGERWQSGTGKDKNEQDVEMGNVKEPRTRA